MSLASTDVELDRLVALLADGIKRADEQMPVALSKRSGAAYQAGIGPHTESATIDLALAATGKVPTWLVEKEQPLDFLLHDQGAQSIIEAAYRYARHEPGADVVLFGTGNPAHVASNIIAILKPPLPEAIFPLRISKQLTVDPTKSIVRASIFE